MNYKIVHSKQFQKDFRRLVMSGRFDLDRYHWVVNSIARGEDLPISCRNHQLSGLGEIVWECHINPNLLLTYKKLENVLILYLIRVGSHSDLF